MANINLSIIIVSYNTSEISCNCLESVYKEINNSDNLNNRTEVIIVDNNSSDDSVSRLKNLLKKSKNPTAIIKNTENLGFAKANNQAIKKAKGKFILLLNSDTIVNKSSISKMLIAMNKYKLDDSKASLLSQYDKLDNLGILAPVLLNEDKTLQAQGGSLPSLSSVFCHMFFLDNIPIIGKLFPSTQQTGLSQNRFSAGHKNCKIVQKGWVGGTAMMIKREVIDEIGNLDENFFMYGEDLEFCLRAKKHHYDIGILNCSKIVHLGSASSTKENALIGEIKGLIYIWSKHMPSWQQPILKTMLWWGSFFRMILYGLTSSSKEKSKIYKKILGVI